MLNKSINADAASSPPIFSSPAIAIPSTIRPPNNTDSRYGTDVECVDRFGDLGKCPDSTHCGGGPGATNFGNMDSPSPVLDASHDLLAALDNWEEKGVAPDKIIASKVVNGATTRTRPLCPYPKKAVYKGTGSADDAANFICK